jgi:hypothetical protein
MWERTGLSQLVWPIATAQKIHAQRTASYGRQHIPAALADDHCRFDGCAQPFGGSQKQVRVGLGMFDLVARHDRDSARIDTERGQIDGCGFHAAAGRDRPGNAGFRQPTQQFASPGQRPNAVYLLLVSGGIGTAKPFDAFNANFGPCLAKKLIGEQAFAHAYLAVDAPDQQFDALCI